MNRRISTALTALGLVVLLAAPLVWWVTSRTDDSSGDVAQIEAALTPSSSEATQEPSGSLVPPGATGETSTTTTTSVPPSEGESTPSTTFLSTPSLDAMAPAAEPTSLRIAALDIVAPVGAYGISRNGQMDVPDNVTDVGWYRWGPSPGESGSAVLAAHVDLAGQGPGVFIDLDTLEPGDVVLVDFDDGSTEAFEVVARATYDKQELPLDVIFSREGPPVLTLITCGGGFDRSSRRYDSNVVVYAVPVDLPAGAAA